MRISGRRGSWRFGPMRVNRVGVRVTSVTMNMGPFRAVLWSAPRRARR